MSESILNKNNTYVYGANVRSELKQFLPDHYSKILEIGCSYGAFRSNLTLPNEYWGVEIDDEIARIAANTLDEVIIGSYDHVADSIPNHYFDLIICNDVIEHMADYQYFLTSIKEKMTKEAYIIGSIPNIRHLSNLYELLVQRDWRYRDAGILDKTHLRFFTKKSLIRTFEQMGYEISEMRGINGYGIFWSLKSIILLILLTIFGADTRYIQFGFKVKGAGSAE
jgi:2-polyprenyl-3-methyl-5-hydroxy-6-metoxy-1,4-benzoquinol methylase